MPQEIRKVVLTIAGFDPSSGAGITADLKTISAHGQYGTACITALTIQTTRGVLRTESVSSELVRETLEALMEDLPPAAVKIGMLGSAEDAGVVADFLGAHQPPNVVLDPIMRSSSGAELLDPAAREVLSRKLLGLAEVITPNLAEASLLTGMEVTDQASAEAACRMLSEMGARNIVVTGGHFEHPLDLLAERHSDGILAFRWYPGERIDTPNTHGTGCAFSTALACELASGKNLVDSVLAAKEYVTGALRNSYSIGKGTGPVNHFFGARKPTER